MLRENNAACSSPAIRANPSASPMTLHRKTPNAPQSAGSTSTAPIADHSSKNGSHTICGIETHSTYRNSATKKSPIKNLRNPNLRHPPRIIRAKPLRIQSAGSTAWALVANPSNKTATHTICAIETLSHLQTFEPKSASICALIRGNLCEPLPSSPPFTTYSIAPPNTIHPCGIPTNPPLASIPNKTFPKSNLSLPSLPKYDH